MSARNKKKLLEVSWVDVGSFDGWVTIKEAQSHCKPFSAKMVGWEIYRNDKYLLLATAFSGDECQGRRVIPLGCVTKIREIDSAKK